MATTAYSNGVENIINGTIDLDTSTIKQLLAQSTYPEDPDQAFIDNGDANDLQSHECNATGYTGGFGGAGRKTATLSISEQTASNRVVTICTDTTWTALGGGTNNTLEGVAWVREITNDAASIPIVFLLFSATLTTNGSDVLVDYDGANGNLRWAV